MGSVEPRSSGNDQEKYDATQSVRSINPRDAVYAGVGASALALAGCGGGGDSDGTGSASLELTDGPVTDAEQVTVEFTGVDMLEVDADDG